MGFSQRLYTIFELNWTRRTVLRICMSFKAASIEAIYFFCIHCLRRCIAMLTTHAVGHCPIETGCGSTTPEYPSLPTPLDAHDWTLFLYMYRFLTHFVSWYARIRYYWISIYISCLFVVSVWSASAVIMRSAVEVCYALYKYTSLIIHSFFLSFQTMNGAAAVYQHNHFALIQSTF